MPKYLIGSNWNKWDLHIHTESSKDYAYTGDGEYADEELVDKWKENGFVAVAITDHFLIDGKRIQKLQNSAKRKGITVFPGVELRTDKGDNNIHIIAIFSEKKDVIELGKSFKHNMIDFEAKNGPEFETIYWNLDNIIDFTEKWEGLLTVHAGNKESGIDKRMNNDKFYSQIKLEYANVIDAFEVNNKHSYEQYKKGVLPYIKDKLGRSIPVIISSDNHDYNNYQVSSNLWIKANPNFNGLKQAFLHPSERIYIGENPDKLLHEQRIPQEIMNNIKINKRLDTEHESNWFHVDLPLNSSLVCIIGNKGSGKSALSDVLGLANNFNDIENLSFLNNKRFNRTPNRYGDYYEATLTWLDSEEIKLSSLNIEKTTIPYPSMTAEYLPQKYVEDLCSNLNSNNFQKEINKVIFSYIPEEERLKASDFEEFMSYKKESKELEINKLYEILSKVNTNIINTEKKCTVDYKKTVKSKIEELKSNLERQIIAKPKEVERPKSQMSEQEIGKLEKIQNQIDKYLQEKEKLKKENVDNNTKYQKAFLFQSEIKQLINNIKLKNKEIKDFCLEFNNNESELIIKYDSPLDNYEKLINKTKEKKEEISTELKKSDAKYKQFKEKKEEKINFFDDDNKKYQDYLSELAKWNESLEKIKGTKELHGTLEYYKSELTYLNSQLQNDYANLLQQRKEIVKKIYDKKNEIKKVYDEVYNLIVDKISISLNVLDEDITFNTKMIIKENETQTILNHINKRSNSRFQGSDIAKKELSRITNEMNLNEFESFYSSLKEILDCGLGNDFDQIDKVIQDKQSFYDDILALKYLKVDYHLTYDGNTLEELSPGERGLLLLVFYLLLSKERKPIIIDQPEDNLDNQSIYSRLVPCIIQAKKNRQVVIVTHNPNIAIACDAEQVIIADINKKTNEINYISGSIENNKINDKIVEILEGTKPAFKLRENKYTSI